MAEVPGHPIPSVTITTWVYVFVFGFKWLVHHIAKFMNTAKPMMAIP